MFKLQISFYDVMTVITFSPSDATFLTRAKVVTSRDAGDYLINLDLPIFREVRHQSVSRPRWLVNGRGDSVWLN